MVPTLGVYITMLTFSVPKVLQHSGGMTILDVMPTGYSSEYVRKLFETLGEAGRNVYLFQQIPLDMIYPGLFAITFSLLLALLFERVLSTKSKIQKLIILPFLAGIFDYLENLGIIVMLNMHPNFPSWVANATNVFSIIKSLITIIVFVLIIYGIIALMMRGKGISKNKINSISNEELRS